MTHAIAPMVRVVVVDDHPVVRAGVVAVLAPAFELVGEAGGEREAVDLCLRTRPDVVVMDLRLADGDGVSATRAILAELPRTRVLALTSYDGDETIHRALEAGVRGYVFKDFDMGELASAVAAVAAGHRHVPASVALRLVANGPRVTLTVREREVLGELAEARRSKVIAARLGMGEATVRTHVENLLLKFGCADRGALVHHAIARGFLD